MPVRKRSVLLVRMMLSIGGPIHNRRLLSIGLEGTLVCERVNMTYHLVLLQHFQGRLRRERSQNNPVITGTVPMDFLASEEPSLYEKRRMNLPDIV